MVYVYKVQFSILLIIKTLHILYFLQTNETNFTQQIGVVNKQFWLHKIVFDGVCLCFTRLNTEHGLEQGLRGIFDLKKERVAGG
jgi:hypothetical protein